MCQSRVFQFSFKHVNNLSGERSYGGRTFTSLAYLQIQEITHTGENPYCCKQCGKAFTYSWGFVYIKSYCMENRPLTVNIVVNSSLVVIIFMYMNELVLARPYECKQCDTTFAYSNSIWKHQRTHIWDRWCQCKQSGKHFKTSTHLQVNKCTQMTETLCNLSNMGKISFILISFKL